MQWVVACVVAKADAGPGSAHEVEAGTQAVLEPAGAGAAPVVRPSVSIDPDSPTRSQQARHG
jgi:hypothetical protein